MQRYLQSLLKAALEIFPCSDTTPASSREYPYPALLPLLQVLTTPAEYQHLLSTQRQYWSGADIPANAPYWRVVPIYTYAECPFCHTRYSEPIDTYTLLGWGIGELSATLYASRTKFHNLPFCTHLLGIQVFMNFHHTAPYELELFANAWGEVPYLTPWFFVENQTTYAILHALPICRPETDQFIPRYTVFALTYFSEDPQEILREHIRAEDAAHAPDSDYWPDTVHPPGDALRHGLYYLSKWAAAGHLGFLDFTETSLPLRIGPNLAWPALYDSIQGKRFSARWSDNKWASQY